MASGSSPIISAASKRFLRIHTEVDVPQGHLDNCPICHEEYRNASERCIRVIGIPACSHSFGSRCLEQWLSTNPFTPKSCPLCRTEWVAGTVRPRHDWWLQASAEEFDAERDELAALTAQLRRETDMLRIELDMGPRRSDLSNLQRARMSSFLEPLSPTETRESRPDEQHPREVRTRTERRPRSLAERTSGGVLGLGRRASQHMPARLEIPSPSRYNEAPVSPSQEPDVTQDSSRQFHEERLEPREGSNFSYMQTANNEVNDVDDLALADQQPFALLPYASFYRIPPNRRSYAFPSRGTPNTQHTQRDMQRRTMQVQATMSTEWIPTQAFDRTSSIPVHSVRTPSAMLRSPGAMADRYRTGTFTSAQSARLRNQESFRLAMQVIEDQEDLVIVWWDGRRSYFRGRIQEALTSTSITTTGSSTSGLSQSATTYSPTIPTAPTSLAARYATVPIPPFNPNAVRLGVPVQGSSSLPATPSTSPSPSSSRSASLLGLPRLTRMNRRGSSNSTHHPRP